MSNVAIKPNAPVAVANLEDQQNPQALLAMIARLQEQLAAKNAPKSESKPKVSMSEKGCMIVRLGGTYPHYFYLTQWEKLMSMLPELQAFVETNKGKFSVLSKEERAAKATATREALKQKFQGLTPQAS